jgi:hypothetical protein
MKFTQVPLKQIILYLYTRSGTIKESLSWILDLTTFSIQSYAVVRYPLGILDLRILITP